MTIDPDPRTVAAHWPYVRRNLQLARARPVATALDLLAELQWDAGGEPVPLGRRRLVEQGELSPGQAGAVWNALVSLERRRVVARYRGSGRRADAWTFRGDLRHWRAMPWGPAGGAVADAIGACACSTFFAVAARNPGHSVGLAARFWLSAEDHLRPPGFFLVDSRGNGETRAATARRPGGTPVDSRGNGAVGARLTSQLEEPSVLLLNEVEDERVEMLLKSIEDATPGQPRGPNGRAVWGAKMLGRLVMEAQRLSIDEAREVASMIRRVQGSYAVRLVTTVAEFAQQVRARRHRQVWAQEG